MYLVACISYFVSCIFVARVLWSVEIRHTKYYIRNTRYKNTYIGRCYLDFDIRIRSGHGSLPMTPVNMSALQPRLKYRLAVQSPPPPTGAQKEV